ncbi:MAG: flippase [Candidatus Thorarchaeota archaeon]
MFLKNTSTGQTIFKNTLWLLSAETFSKLLLFFLIIWIARYLGTEGYGKFSFAFAFVSLFAILADFGLATLTVREASRDKSKTKKYIDNILIIKLFLGILTFVLIILSVQLLGKTPEVKTLVYLAGIFTVIQSFTQFLYAVFRVFEKMEYQALSKIIYGLSLFAIVAFVLWNQLGLRNLIIAYIIADSLTLILALFLVWKKFTKFSLELDFSFWKKILAQAWPFALSAIFISVYYYMDSVMLSVMKNDQAVGWYNAAYKPIIFMTNLAGIVLQSFFPVISRFYKESIEKVNYILDKFARLMVTVAIPLAFGGTMLALPIINLLYGQEYLDGTLAFQILVWTAAIIYISIVYGNSLQACDRQKISLIGVGIGAGINIILNFILIPYFSLNGAAIATLLTELLVFIFMYFQLNKFAKVNFARYILKPFIASIIMCGLLYILKDLHVILLILIGAACYFSIMIVIKGLVKEDLNFLQSLVSSKVKND